MVTRFGAAVLLAAPLIVAAPGAQAPLQQTDAAFVKLVREWTSKPEFLSPLMDHLPTRAGVPTAKDILGYHLGEPKKPTYSADQYRFFRALENALPGRVKTFVIG
ncbi:MAG: hypothetical protein H0T71_02885 [Acidobacteria bacterium]|nr:hypothetical protein [Acidobacteriota bacterium]